MEKTSGTREKRKPETGPEASSRVTGARIIVRLLEEQGVAFVAGIPGGCNLPIHDAFIGSSIRHVLTRHEQGAGFMAQGAARVTGRAGVCLATSGPGATNLVTAIADARLDSVPLVAITGQVPGPLLGTDAFQEVDTFGLTLPITKHNYLVRDASELARIIPEAFEIAETGRPGPVVIDVPKDVQTQEVPFSPTESGWERPAPQDCTDREAQRMAEMIHESERPVLYVGGGASSSGAAIEIRGLSRKSSIPVACTLMGKGVHPPDDPLHLGLLGMHGRRSTNLLLEEADLLIALGVRFDDRATGKVEEFCPKAKVLHVDIDRSEIDKIRSCHFSLAGDLKACLARLLPLVKKDERPGWRGRVDEVRRKNPDHDPLEDSGWASNHPVALIRALATMLDPSDVVATDVGQHQMWTAQHYPFSMPRTFLTSGGLGTMGFGLPAALGAALARPGGRTVCVSGDGSLLMNVQELATMADLSPNLTVVVMNNGHLGLVRQQQELFYQGRYHASRFETGPDFAALARAFGIPGVSLAREEDPLKALRRAVDAPGPCLVEALVDPRLNVYPMVPPGAPNTEMIEGGRNGQI